MRNHASRPISSKPAPLDTDLSSASSPYSVSKYNPSTWWRYLQRRWHALVVFVSPEEGTLFIEAEPPIAAVMPIWTSLTKEWTAGSFYVNETKQRKK